MEPSSSPQSEKQMEEVKILLQAKGLLVIIGAGVSIAAGIPTFRGAGCISNLTSSSLREVMSVRIKRDENLRTEYCKVVTTLASKTAAAKPTPFHFMLRALDNARLLARLYTQNIDSLESKVGFDLLDHSGKARCIALHGSLLDLRCDSCSEPSSLEGLFHLLKIGVLPICCNTQRTLPTLRERTRPCGTLYPDIVLYDEPVKDEEYITAAVNSDIRKCAKKTVLLIAGTSLTIPGVIQMIKVLGGEVIRKGGTILYVDIEPRIPPTLDDLPMKQVVMDCQVFAETVIAELEGRGVNRQSEGDLRRDMRPLWDWI